MCEYEYSDPKQDNINHLSLILMLWKEMVYVKNISPDYKNFHFIEKCYLRVIENVKGSKHFDQESENQIKICLNKLMHDIPSERVKFGLKANDHILAKYQFRAYLLLYHERNSNKVLQLFETEKG